MNLKFLITKSDNKVIVNELTYDLCAVGETLEKALSKLSICLISYLKFSEDTETSPSINHEIPKELLEKFENTSIKITAEIAINI